MNSLLASGFALAVGLVACAAAAQSPSEIAALREAERVQFFMAVSKRCDALSAQALPKLMPLEELRDRQGRVITSRSEHGFDVVFEYAGGSQPIAMTILGKRVDLSLVGAEAREQAMQALRAREILYRKAKEICGMAPAPGLDAGRLYCPMQLRGIDTETQS